MMFINTAM